MIGRLTLLGLLCAAPALGADLFSPGELSEAHQELEGLGNCRKCHGDGEQVSQAKCQDCHRELQDRVKAQQGYHGRMSEETRGCQGCHHEHQGRSFKLVQWVPSKQGFLHQRTGWPLEGAHLKTDCAECHQPRRVFSPAVKALLKKKPSRTTFLGLSTRCADCHFDEHRDQLGDDCASCHREAGWKPAPGFDHRKTDYPLTGKHRQVKCKECHPAAEDTTTPANAFPTPRARSHLKFADLPHASCLDCHQDPHQTRFGQRCQSCHTTAGWQTVKTPGGSQAFHDKTRFPLQGMHEEVDCKACHGPFRGRPARFKGLEFSQCTSCHLDAHLGQLTEGRAVQPCDRCHTVEGFSPARFEPEDHARTGFVLEGAHRAVACSRCHLQEDALQGRVTRKVRQELLRQRRPLMLSLTRFELGKDAQQCQGCHLDVHAGQFEAQVKAGGCQACHSQETFTPARFDHQRDARFALEGAHAQAQCGACHPTQRVGGRPMVRYRPLETACQGCHADPHAGQFGRGEGGTDCARCHTSTAFTPAHFQHQPPFTAFTLDGRHAKVACGACHPTVEVGKNQRVTRYAQLPTTCEGCHTDFHRGEFKGFTP